MCELRVKEAIFGVIWGCFEGFGPCLGISHPTHPHLGKLSEKQCFFGSLPLYAKVKKSSKVVNRRQKKKNPGVKPAKTKRLEGWWVQLTPGGQWWLWTGRTIPALSSSTLNYMIRRAGNCLAIHNMPLAFAGWAITGHGQAKISLKTWQIAWIGAFMRGHVRKQ